MPVASPRQAPISGATSMLIAAERFQLVDLLATGVISALLRTLFTCASEGPATKDAAPDQLC